jgi:hypothetical protein
MDNLTTKVMKILDLLYDAKELLADIDSNQEIEVQHAYHALKLEMMDRDDLTQEQKDLIYN